MFKAALDAYSLAVAIRACRIGVALLVLLGVEVRASETHVFTQPDPVTKLLDANCYACHDAETQKGKVRLDNLKEIPVGDRLDLLNKVQEQIFINAMPPKEKLNPGDHATVYNWVSGELAAHNASKLEDKLRYYRYGNYISHEKLFSGEIKDMPYTPSRRWRINEFIYHELVNNVLELKDKARRASFYGVIKPFNLPAEPGVKYYDTEVVRGGELLTLLANAKWIASKQLKAALLESGYLKMPDEYLALEKEPKGKGVLGRMFPDELWNPGRTAPELQKLVMNKGEPSESDLAAAVAYQFRVAFQRAPSANEMTRYIAFLKDGIKTGGVPKALEKMLVSVLMEPDFLYRSEFGDGKPDQYGRTKLTPREASYAISYALTDNVPDETLAKAAASGALATKDDYRREVLRLLENDAIAKPRILRFFQDYFGYYDVFNVFKDEERFGGAYNPHRVVSTRFINRVPGKVSTEADTLILSILKSDKDVLLQLLTTDKFFVHHNGKNEEMAKKAKDAIELEKTEREVYVQLKDKKSDEDYKAVAKQLNYFVDKKGEVGVGPIRNRMPWFKLLYGEDGKRGINRLPMPRDGEHTDHSVKMYNLDHENWSYQPVQPIKLENRKGILTHPAWLVAFSQNAHTDPVKRGRWIREKLLGGYVPDVPITVDANVPEDHHKTLRERFSVTEKKDCWGCHQKMNPLGNTFEVFDDFGRFRKDEMLEHHDNVIGEKIEVAGDTNGIIKKQKILLYKTKPVNASGSLDGTGDSNLDGEVKDAFELIDRLAKSERVRQTFVRNVFRYFMGRNEMLSDSKTLIEADRAYVSSGGSFKALVVSLLTSDSFIYRK